MSAKMQWDIYTILKNRDQIGFKQWFHKFYRLDDDTKCYVCYKIGFLGWTKIIKFIIRRDEDYIMSMIYGALYGENFRLAKYLFMIFKYRCNLTVEFAEKGEAKHLQHIMKKTSQHSFMESYERSINPYSVKFFKCLTPELVERFEAEVEADKTETNMYEHIYS